MKPLHSACHLTFPQPGVALRLREVLALTQDRGLIEARENLLISEPVFVPLTQDALLPLETGAEAGDCYPESICLLS